MVVVTAGPAGAATVVVCCVVVAGLVCSTRSDLTEQADVAASRIIKIDTRMAEASLRTSRCCCSVEPCPKRFTFPMVARDDFEVSAWTSLRVAIVTRQTATGPMGSRDVCRLAAINRAIRPR